MKVSLLKVIVVLLLAASKVESSVPDSEPTRGPTREPTREQTPGCPFIRERIIGTCQSQCGPGNNSTCSDGELCCFNGCGHVCTAPVTHCMFFGIEYPVGESFPSDDGCNTCSCSNDGSIFCTEIGCPPALRCPRPQEGSVGTCVNRCSGNSNCSEGQSCCPGANGCASGCVNLVTVCHGPNGNVYQVNETFPARDRCNNCTCLSSGRVSCTSAQCLDHLCYQPPVASDCALTGYYYEPHSSLCLSMTGLCGGNNHNAFSTPRDCYERCNPNSVCNAPIYPDDFDESSVVCDVIIRKWSFNATRGQCVEINYLPCGPDSQGYNVFEDLQTCARTCIRPRNTTCPPGVPQVRCFVDPCSVNRCPNFPRATCKSNYCGGCNYNFFDANNRDVTELCERSAPVPMVESFCPFLNESIGGICVQSCTTDNDCSGDQLCCSNGCGMTCTDPVAVPYYNIPPVCPQTDLLDQFGVCAITNQSCSNNSQCRDSELCCRSRCGKTCQRAVRSSTPCYTVNHQILPTRRPPGMYVPACTNDGLFSPIQCRASTGFCWCVNVRTGQPTTSYYPRGVRPQCSGCSHNNRSYSVGETFQDSCNQCTCLENGNAICTLRACIDTCSLTPDPGPCRASIPAYYYDRQSGTCRQFTYGGCRGNANKFKTVSDCLRMCHPQDRCLQPPAPGICEAYIPSIFFNSTSGECERFIYGGCGGNDNRFRTAMECQQECSPDTNSDPCLDVVCDIPNCRPGYELTWAGQSCCPVCRPTAECSSDEYRCLNGTCIPSEHVCDGLNDCPGGHEEERCEEECPFMCGDRTCVRRSQVCDRIVDCSDGADIRNCTRNFQNVYYLRQADIPTMCPNTADLLGACVIECSNNSECRDGNICCSNGCGRTCMEGIEAQLLCLNILSRASGRLGEFRPQCEEDGSFSPVQCHGSTGYCWCVDTSSGQPVSEGVRGERPQCQGCSKPNGEVIAMGESFPTEDGCNRCTCSRGREILCTLRACRTASCRYHDRTIESDATLDDECNTCRCIAGSLNCSRKNCTATTGKSTGRVKVRLPFDGNFNMIRDRLDDFKREVIRSFLNLYSRGLRFIQDQIANVEVLEGSIIVVITLTETSNTEEGANITVLLGQVEQDYEMGLLVIRYEDQILTPSGEFDIEEDTQVEESSGFMTLHIALIIAAIVILSAIIFFVIAAVVMSQKKRPYSNKSLMSDDSTLPQVTDPNDYEMAAGGGDKPKDTELKEDFA